MSATLIHGKTSGGGTHLPVKVTAYGDGTGVLAVSTLYDEETASSAGGSVAVAAAATDVVVIGSANAGYIRRITVSAVATAAGATSLIVIARTSGASGGTATTVPDVNHTTFAAGNQTVALYTANPTVGSGTGVLAQRHLQYSSAALAVVPIPLVFDFSHAPIPVSFANSHYVALNLNGATVAGLTLNVTVEFERTE